MKNEKGYVDSFVKLIQCPTISNSGDEYFEKFHKVLEQEFPNVHKTCEKIDLGGNMLLFRWKGKNPDKPAVLMAHQDVVPADGGDWKYPPFSGTVADGKVWGRGTMDCKNTLFSTIQAVDELISEGLTPEQDIYLSYSDCEETSGPGAAMARDWFIKNKIKPGVVVDEGGAIVEKAFPQMTKPFAMVGIQEKGYCNIKFIARGAGGHSSQPPKNTPIARLSAFVNYCETHRIFKRRVSEAALEMVKGLSDGLTGSLKFLAKEVDMLSDIVVPIVSKTPVGNALFSTTMVFTMSGGASAPNVIPQEAYVIANLRFAPDEKIEKGLNKIKKLAAKFDLEAEITKEPREASPIVDLESPEYKNFVDSIKKVYPDVGIAPYLIMGGTDCRTMQEICKNAIRCTPCRLTTEQLAGMHASNENIDVAALAPTVAFFKEFLKNYK